MDVQPSPDFVDVDRTFHTLDGTKPLNADEIEAWSHYAGVTTWKDLLTHPRVVVLAEANSGKTQEFRNQVKKINDAGGFAFFATIEVLGRKNFEISLSGTQRSHFREWKSDAAPGYFFLDSLDEAKLNEVSLELALNELSAALDNAYDRATIIVSSRGTDWDGEEDLRKIRDAVPLKDTTDEEEGDPDEALISALDREGRSRKDLKRQTSDVTVVAMAGLSREQRALFLAKKGLSDIPAFEDALYQKGLSAMADRPGDLAMLLRFWMKEGCFGPLIQMTEHSLAERLKERQDRKDATILSKNEARQGAERLAAALTLGKKLTIKTKQIGSATDDAIDPSDVLPDWQPNKIRALLNRGLFAPSTYGRIRFHHRSAVEYLTASWFARLLEGPQAVSRPIHDIIVSKGFDVTTVPPSLRAPAAWLAPRFPDLMNSLLGSDPLILIAYGDPGSLPLPTRTRLLHQYARLDADASVSDIWIDSHSLWMFSHPTLSPALRTAWEENTNAEFRMDLLRIIEQGRIVDCRDLVFKAALNKRASNEMRIVAARALAAIGDAHGRRRLSKDLISNAAKYGPRLAPDLALTVFPDALSVDELLAVIAISPPASRFQVEGFGYAMERLFAACRTSAERDKLLGGILALALTAPLEEFHKTSLRHAVLLDRLAPMLRLAITKSDNEGISENLIALLSVAARADADESIEPGARLHALVNARGEMRRRLFWADVQHAFATETDQVNHPFVWWLHTFGRRLWSLSQEDCPWLEESVDRATSIPLKRMAFSALCVLARAAPNPEIALARLRQKFSDMPVLTADFSAFTAPRIESESERRWRARDEALKAAKNDEFLRNSKEWKSFRDELRKDTGRLDDPTRMLGWPGAGDLHSLTRWLAMKTQVEFAKAPLEHKRLRVPFGESVEIAYQRGLKKLWRATEPERPTQLPDGRMSEKHVSRLSVAGLNLEAKEPGWAASLTASEATRAMQHVIFQARDAPEWLEHFIQVAPNVALKVLLDELQKEWSTPGSQPAPFLSRFQHRIKATGFLRNGLIALLRGEEVADPLRLSGMNYLVNNFDLTAAERLDLAQIVRQRLDKYRAEAEWEWVVVYLCLYFNLDVDTATKLLPTVLHEQPAEKRYERALGIIGSMFGMSSGLVYSLGTASAHTLRLLLEVAYREVHPSGDQIHEGVYSSDNRDNAQDGRGRILSALIHNGSEDAYRALRALATSPVIGSRRRRFDQIARGMAEAAAERLPWMEAQVEQFESQAVSPIRTNGELLRYACEFLEEIETEFRTGDYSLQLLVQSAQDEMAIQQWLARDFHKFSKGRYQTTREKQVKNERRPDIVLTVPNGQEVVIEIKHGGKNWTLDMLRESLKRQLAEDYLLPRNRRSGVLVITNHNGKRFWKSVKGKDRLSFKQVIENLTTLARDLTSNVEGFIEVTVRGLDASSPVVKRKNPRPLAHRRKSSKPSPRTARRTKPLSASRKPARKRARSR